MKKLFSTQWFKQWIWTESAQFSAVARFGFVARQLWTPLKYSWWNVHGSLTSLIADFLLFRGNKFSRISKLSIWSLRSLQSLRKNVQQTFWLSCGNHTSVIAAVTAFHNNRWGVVSTWSQRMLNIFTSDRSDRSDRSHHMDTSLNSKQPKGVILYAIWVGRNTQSTIFCSLGELVSSMVVIKFTAFVNFRGFALYGEKIVWMHTHKRRI